MKPNDEKQWIEVRDPIDPKKLICRFRRDCLLLEIQRGGKKTIVDLRQYGKDEEDDGS